MNDNTATRLGNLFRELQGGGARPDDAPPKAPPAAVTKAASDPSRCLEEFVLVDEVAGSRVWKAWDRLLGRWGALKVWSSGTREPIDLPRFSHPHAVPVHRVGEAAGRLYLVTAWIEGASLDRMRPTARVALEAALAAAEVVHAMRQASIATRALTPSDLMIDRRGSVWVLNAQQGSDPDPAASLRALLKGLSACPDAPKLPAGTPAELAESLRRVLEGSESKGAVGRVTAWLKTGR